MTLKTFSVKTETPSQLVDVTPTVRHIVRESGVVRGSCVVYVPHTTAGVTINENTDPNVKQDILDALERIVPAAGPWLHDEGNAHAHVKATLVGSSVTVFVEAGQLALGTWQSLFLCEFDGPRTRNLLVRVAPG